MRRRLLNLAAAVSLVPCVGLVVLALQSHGLFLNGFYRAELQRATEDEKHTLRVGYDGLSFQVEKRGGLGRPHGWASYRAFERYPFSYKRMPGSSVLGFRAVAGVIGSRPGLPFRAWAIPYWFMILMTATMPTLWWRRHRLDRRRRGRLSAGLCPTCGYDLRASGERCPECGAVPEAAQPAA